MGNRYELKAEADAYISKNRVFKWEVAEVLGLSDSSFSKKLRRLDEDTVNAIKAAVDKIVEERKK